jgi:hypothetical protein
MRIRSIVLAAFTLGSISSGAQAAYVAFGNNQGGLIPSPPDLSIIEVRRDIAQTAIDHCAWYNKVAYITGAVPGYGNYVSFTCLYASNYDPVKAGQSLWWSRR